MGDNSTNGQYSIYTLRDAHMVVRVESGRKVMSEEVIACAFVVVVRECVMSTAEVVLVMVCQFHFQLLR